jgi:hypothetical protein
MDIYRDFFDFSDVSSMYIPSLDDDSDNNLGPDIAPPPDSDSEEDESTPSTLLILQMLPAAGPKPPPKRGNIVGARMLALSLFDAIIIPDFVAITSKTGVSRSSVYKLRSKAISRGWMPGTIVEPKHVDDAPRLGRPKTSTVISLLIINTMTKNSITRGWSYARIAAEITGIPGQERVSASTVYRVLTENGYGVLSV